MALSRLPWVGFDACRPRLNVYGKKKRERIQSDQIMKARNPDLPSKNTDGVKFERAVQQFVFRKAALMSLVDEFVLDELIPQDNSVNVAREWFEHYIFKEDYNPRRILLFNLPAATMVHGGFGRVIGRVILLHSTCCVRKGGDLEWASQRLW